MSRIMFEFTNMHIKGYSPGNQGAFANPCLSRKFLLLVQESKCLLAHHDTILLCSGKILGRNICVASIWRVILAIGCKALRDANTRAVELTNNPLLVGLSRAWRR